LAVTGIAGPSGAAAGKPVGLVFCAASGPGGTRVERFLFLGDRSHVQAQAAQGILDILRRRLEEKPAR
jgi:nicotinamide-nucleotide amidase